MTLAYLQNSDKRIRHSNQLFVFGLAVMVIGLPLSMFLMSVSQMIMLGAWLLRGDYKLRSKKFISNKVALSFAVIYLLHVVGLFWTTDFNYALRDLRIKGPLLIIAFVFSTMDVLNKKTYVVILKLFVLAVFTSTIISTGVWLGFTHKPINDIRQISVFISHIRLALLICLAVYACAYFVYSKEISFWQRIFSAGLIIWFIIFLIILEAATGIIILGFTSFIILTYFFLKKKIYWAFALLLSGSAAMLFYVGSTTKKMYDSFNVALPVNIDTLPEFTSRGNAYEHLYDTRFLENGNCTSIYLCWVELRSAWNKRSKVDFDGPDEKGNKLIFTLVRYMSSKGLTKDYDGIMALTATDIMYIEKGIPSVNRWQYGKVAGRIYELVWEYNNYRNTGNASSSSFMQRFEFWKASVNVIKENIWTGVGTGDNQIALNEYYEISNSKLEKENWLRSHNQFLAIGVSFGIIGLLIFLLCLLYPCYGQFHIKNYFYITFFITCIISMFTEDTLETQAGLTFFIFFSSFYLFLKPENLH